MDRRNFLNTMGLTGAALFATYCLGGCTKKEDDVTPDLPATGLSLDLNTAQYAGLKNNGSFVVLANEKIVVARTNAGLYVAVTRICSHEQQEQVSYFTSPERFECGAHGAQFNTNGGGLNSNGSKGLRTYKTEINPTGDTLKILNS